MPMPMRAGALLLLAPAVQAVMNAGGVPCKSIRPARKGQSGSRGEVPRLP